MPQERLPMRKIRDVLRLRAAGMSKRQVAASLSVSKTTVLNCLRRAEVEGLGWPLPDDLTDEVHGPERLEAACDRALEIGARSYTSVTSILKNNLDRTRPEPATDGPAITHSNIRGSTYFH